MFEDQQPMALTDDDERWQTVLEDASVFLIALSDDAADRVRRFLRDELTADASLAGDTERVGRLVQRVTGVLRKAESQAVEQGAVELML